MLVRVVLTLFLALVILAIFGLIFLRIIFPDPLSREETEHDFVENQNDIMIVTNYLLNSDYTEMSIHHTDDGETIYTNRDGYITISDLQVLEAISTLFSAGYKGISKSTDTINFLRSTRLMDFGSGIAYSIDGNGPQLSYLTRSEPLSEPNWYYYEEDFNLWREQNREAPSPMSSD